MGTETTVLPSGIRDPSGYQWRSYSSMLLQAHDLYGFIDSYFDGHLKSRISQSSQKYYMRYLLKLIDKDVRSTL